jgi:pimeloyl-ACP methyl ester carboxylesterase
VSAESAVTYPGARRPDRRRIVDASGLRLAVYEWGSEDDPPLLLAHGGFDFAGTFDVFAPLLADGGWRVVTWDQRGHGDSEHAALYAWDADVRDGLAVLDTVTGDPVPLIGHSKGGGILTQLAEALPHRVKSLVSIDGLPSRRRAPDVADHERTRLLAEELGGWLDHRRRIADLQRKPGTLDELARRRQRMNPRLSLEWLRYIASIGARRDEDGWRWKIDPALRFGGFGPWRPDWSMERLPALGVPLLGILGAADEPMGWGTTAESVRPYLPDDARIVPMEETGHFVHIERPKEVADLVLEFLS